MPAQVENLNLTLPHDLTLKTLCDGHCANVIGLAAVKPTNHVF
jgi:hypothetical protein